MRKGKHAFKRLRRGNDSDVHEWRKQEKHLLYQEELLEKEPIPLKTLKHLADLLGTDHDLVTFRAHWLPLLSKKTRKALKTQVQRKLKKLRQKTRKLGRKIYH